MKPHWPAIYQMGDGFPILTNQLYPDEASAAKDLGKGFVRLASELPPLLIAPRPEVKPMPKELTQSYGTRPNRQPASNTGQKGFDWKTGKRS